MVTLWSKYLQLQKIAIFSLSSHILLCWKGPAETEKSVFASTMFAYFSAGIEKKFEKLKIFLESCKVTSKLSVDSFVDSWDRLVRQKSNFKKKIFENVANTQTPPPG